MSSVEANEAAPPGNAPGPKVDWAWLLGEDMASLAGWAAAGLWAWPRDAYAWRYRRLPENLRAGLPAPAGGGAFFLPANAFPVLSCNIQKGTRSLSFVRTVIGPPDHSEISDRNAAATAAAAQAVALLAHSRQSVRVAWIQPYWAVIDGGSAGLSAFIQACLSLLHIPFPDGFIATGGWQNGPVLFDGTQLSGKFVPVAEDTLGLKLRLAEEWGFTRIFLVDGQTGWEKSGWPEERIIFLPAAPALALPVIVREILAGAGMDSAEADETLAATLEAFDRAMVNSSPNDRNLEATVTMTAPFVDGLSPREMPLSAYLARDIRSRAYLHFGDVGKARDELAALDSFATPHPLPAGWLSLYLTYEVLAHRSVIAVDTGRWGDEGPEHAALDEAIDRLCRDCSSVDRMLVASWLLSARAMRLRFVGRLARKKELIIRAHDDLTRYEDAAMRLARHAIVGMGMGNHGERRRQNNLIKVYANLKDLNALDGEYRSRTERLWPGDMPELSLSAPEGAAWLVRDEDRRLSPFDIAAWLQWHGVLKKKVSGGGVELALDRAEAGTGGATLWYPWTLVAENALRYRLGSEADRDRAAGLLRRAVYFNPEFRNGMFSILGIRAAALAGMEDDMVQKPDKEPFPGLLDLAEKLLKLQKDKRVSAGPY